MKIYKLEVTSKLGNYSSEYVRGYYSTLEKAKIAQLAVFKDFGVDILNEENLRYYLDVREAIEIKEIELDINYLS